MEWLDEGIVLSTKTYGENSALVVIFTSENGLHSGLVRNASSKKLGVALQPSTQVAVRWYGRLEEHLGRFTLETIKSRADLFMSDRLLLSGFNSISTFCLSMLPERQSTRSFYNKTKLILDGMVVNENWPLFYLRWELNMLSELGFGLDLSKCVLTGSKSNLKYISPKSGRAVSADAGEFYKKKLLAFPSILNVELDRTNFSLSEVVEGLKITGFFIEKWLMDGAQFDNLLDIRGRFISILSSNLHK